MSETEIHYKPNVAGILRNRRGLILVAERLGMRGAWQFPQGGIDGNETPEQALVRELWEEIGVPAFHLVLTERRGPYRYLYGNGRVKKGFHGKEQIYFLCDYSGPDDAIEVETRHPEFQDYRWIDPVQFQIEWLPEMKREVYRTVFMEFFGLKI
jgi:putative (di)nucleoside polyphosphate hydrolase